MPKVVLPPVASLANQTSAVNAINNNYERIEDAFDNTITRDGLSPNQMEADFDLNSHQLLNVGDPVAETDGVNLRSVRPLVEQFASEIAETVVTSTRESETFTATAGQTAFVLSHSPMMLNNTWVYDNGLIQVPGVDYTLGGTNNDTIIFPVGRTLGHTILIRYDRALPVGASLAEQVVYDPASGAPLTTVASRLDALEAATGAALVGYKRPEVGAVTRTLAEKSLERISVKDFGAKGDYPVTDDTAAFQAALNAAAGKELFIPNGSYKLTAGLTVPAGTNIIGAGRKNTALFFTLPSASTAKLFSFNSGGTLVFGGGMRDMDIVDLTPNPATTVIYVEDTVEGEFEYIQTTGGRIGMHFTGGDNDVNSCLISSLGGVLSQTIGILAENYAGVGIYNTMVQNSQTPGSQARFGYLFRGGASPTMHAANTFGCEVGCNLTATGAAMLWPELVNCQFDTGSDTGLIIDAGAGGSVYGLSAINVWSSTFGNYGVHIVPGSGLLGGLNFNGGRIFGNASVGLWIEGGTDIVVEGMDISGNGTSAASGVLISGAVDGVTINGNTIGAAAGLSATQLYGIQIQGVAAQNVTITSNNLLGNITAGLINGSTSASVKISANAGFDVAAIAPTLTNSWVNNGGVTGTAGYWKDENNVVHLSGLIKNGTIATAAFTLPVGYRPLFDRYFPTIANGAVGLLIVQQSGAVIPQSGSNVYFSLDGTSFKTT